MIEVDELSKVFIDECVELTRSQPTLRSIKSLSVYHKYYGFIIKNKKINEDVTIQYFSLFLERTLQKTINFTSAVSRPGRPADLVKNFSDLVKSGNVKLKLVKQTNKLTAGWSITLYFE
jgi:hypothetical protein